MEQGSGLRQCSRVAWRRVLGCPSPLPRISLSACSAREQSASVFVACSRNLGETLDDDLLLSEVPRIDTSQPRWSQATYLGRVRHMQAITDIRNLFATDATMQTALQLLNDYDAGAALPGKTVGDLYAAKRLRDSTFHPDTGEKIFMPFRFSAWVPVNVLVVGGLLMPNPSTAGIVFWQWVNQSVNVAFNHANRNASNEMPLERVATAYAASVTISCGIALGMTALVRRGVFPKAVSALIPFTSVASAGAANVFMMRANEMVDGIQVMLPQSRQPVGVSQKAGVSALIDTALSRVAGSVIVLSVPPIVLSLLSRTAWMKRNPRYELPLNLVLIAGALATLPFTIGLFPQYREIETSRLEERFHQMRTPVGEPIHTLVYNRGL